MSYHKALKGSFFALLAVALLTVAALPAGSEEPVANPAPGFSNDGFVLINPTLPNSKLNFDDDSSESCCAKDYTPDGQPIVNVAPDGTVQPGASSAVTTAARTPARNEFERSNPRYVENGAPDTLVSCDRFADLPELAANIPPIPAAGMAANSLPITSYSTNVSIRSGATYFSNPAVSNTSDFHIETAGGGSTLRLQDVNGYSICMARGGNVAMVANTDNASIITYNGSDRILLAGSNTNMFTRTGAGDDIIELYQARPLHEDGSDPNRTGWAAYQIYKTAISGGTDTDTLVIKGTPMGTKWCHIGGYRTNGEYFNVVEFALPPSVTEGPRRQRINIGKSIEYVIMKGKRYRLNDFLAHGEPVSTMARRTPIDAPLY